MAYPLPAHVRRWWGRVDTVADRIGTAHRWLHGPANFDTTEAGVEEEFHPDPSLELCLDGILRVEKPDGRVDLQPGDALLIAPGVWHRTAPMRPGSVRFEVGFMPRYARVYFQSADDTWCGRFAAQPSLDLITAAVAADDPEGRRVLVARLVATIANEPVTHLLFNSFAQWKMVQALWTRIRLGLTVDEMIAASGMSRTHAYRLFLAGYGLTPKRAIEAARLRLAGQLLAGGTPVAGIARRCGFPSADTFRRAWKRRHGRPPRASRDSAG